MRRRDVLTSIGAAGLSACALTPQADPLSVADGRVFQPVKSSMDRVTRTLVGLRPFRKPGPRLELVKVGKKTVVHNYGHGGGGVSLSWGVAELAAEKVRQAGSSEVAVLGSGVVGLSTAILLQRAGVDVTIYAEDFPPYTTSNVAGAMWHPVTLFERDQVSAETMAMLHLASKIAFLRFLTFANDPKYGVYWIRQYSLSERPMDTSRPYMGGDDLYPGLVRNQPSGPFGFARYDAYHTLMIDPDIYLRALVNDFLAAGGRMEERVFESAGDLDALTHTSVVNCLGLGAGEVFGDESLIPARGQLTFLMPQEEIDYGYAGNAPGHGLLYMFPRKTGILLGGSVDKGDWTLDPYPSEVSRMVEGHAALSARLTA